MDKKAPEAVQARPSGTFMWILHRWGLASLSASAQMDADHSKHREEQDRAAYRSTDVNHDVEELHGTARRKALNGLVNDGEERTERYGKQDVGMLARERQSRGKLCEENDVGRNENRENRELRKMCAGADRRFGDLLGCTERLRDLIDDGVYPTAFFARFDTGIHRIGKNKADPRDGEDEDGDR